MLKHRARRASVGLPGCIIGIVGLLFNFYTFPHNPGTKGLIDVGPLVGFWFLVVSIKVILSLKWLDMPNK